MKDLKKPQRPTHPSSQSPNLLKEIAWLFFKLGSTAFGGPAAHIALMEEEVVHRRKWLSHEAFLDLLGAANLIPGPNSTELAIHIGYQRAGWSGLLVAGCCFVFPAVILVWLIAVAYVKFGSLPQIQGILDAVKPVITAIVVHSLYRLVRSALKTKLVFVLFLTALAGSALGVGELLVLLGTGLLMVCCKGPIKSAGAMLLVAASTFIADTAAAFSKEETPVRLHELFLVFFKIGSVLFGSGYVLLAFLQTDFVTHRQWLTPSQLMDAVAVGQFTPGPVFTTATFVGYLIAGHLGAGLATLGIFLPAFFFVAISKPLIPRLRSSAMAGAFLDGVNSASLALLAAVSWQLGRGALHDWSTVLIAGMSFVILLLFPLNSMWLVLVGAAIGVLRG